MSNVGTERQKKENECGSQKLDCRGLKQARRQREDGGKNHLVIIISYLKESLLCIIHRMEQTQLNEDNAWIYGSNKFQ